MSDTTGYDEQPSHHAPARRYVARKHSQKKGAQRTAPPRTRADVGGEPPMMPAARAEPTREPEMEVRTRRSRDRRAIGDFDLPSDLKKPGWDYQFCVHTVLNQPIGGAELAAIHEGGWRPEKNKHWPGVAPPGLDPDGYVERGGQVLYSRPMHLTMEARNEDHEAAQQQVRDRVQGALEGRVAGGEGIANIKGIRPTGMSLEIEGQAGTQPPILRQMRSD